MLFLVVYSIYAIYCYPLKVITVALDNGCLRLLLILVGGFCLSVYCYFAVSQWFIVT